MPTESNPLLVEGLYKRKEKLSCLLFRVFTSANMLKKCSHKPSLELSLFTHTSTGACIEKPWKRHFDAQRLPFLSWVENQTNWWFPTPFIIFLRKVETSATLYVVFLFCIFVLAKHSYIVVEFKVPVLFYTLHLINRDKHGRKTHLPIGFTVYKRSLSMSLTTKSKTR